MTLSPIESDAFKQIERVAELHLQGKSPYAIARSLSIKVVEAKHAIQQWQEIVNNDMESRDAARDHLNAMVQRYESLISQANDNLADLRQMTFDEKVSAQINATLKNIADFDAKRLDFLQRAGMLDGAVGDEMARLENERDMILGILRNDLCPSCQLRVRDRISELTGVVEGTVVEDDDAE